MATLDPAALGRIEAAVRRAEAGTAGEIVVVVAARAGTYRSVPLGAALLLALAAPWPLVALTALSTPRILVAQAAVALGVLALFRLAPVWIRLVPRAIRRARAREAAARAFWTRGLDRTSGRTGILIYVALAERYTEIVADAGIDARVGETAWRETVEDLVETLRTGNVAAGLERAVERVGAILARHAPPGEAADELPNAVIVTE